MKSWIKIVTWALMVCTFIASCTEVKDTLPGTDSVAEEGYLSFQLHTYGADATSRATTDPGTDDEQKVTSVYLLIYAEGGSSATLMHRIAIDATNTSGSFAGDDVIVKPGIPLSKSRFVTKPIALDKNNYQLMMLINPTDAILARAVEGTNTLADMQAAITQTQANDYYTNKGMMMTNAGGIVHILESDLKATEAAAEQEPVAVPVERMLAKVYVYENKSDKLTETLTGGTIESISWGLSTVNRQTYVMRMADKLNDGTTQESGFIADRSRVYAKDPNFTGNIAIANNEAERNRHFTTLNPLGNKGFQPWNENDKTTDYHEYVLENTVSQDDQNTTLVDPLLYTTHVVLKAIIKNPGRVITDDDYYSFSYTTGTNTTEWKAFTHAQAVEWFNGTYPSDMPAALHQALTEAEAQPGSPFKFSKVSGQAPPPPFAYASAATSAGRVTFHKAGLNIYRIPIMHFGTAGASMPGTHYGYYGVVRNNTYNIIINSIKGPGTNTTGEGYIAAEIIVNPWFNRTWEEGLEPN